MTERLGLHVKLMVIRLTQRGLVSACISPGCPRVLGLHLASSVPAGRCSNPSLIYGLDDKNEHIFNTCKFNFKGDRAKNNFKKLIVKIEIFMQQGCSYP